jgi:5-methylcytosine-specific restriction endonuclease McrA
MNTNILATATGLSDRDLLARLDVLAGREREASAELVAHLAALDSRPAVYASQGYGSLFSYCTHALGLSEDAACSRIEAARAGRRFPVILDLLATGDVTLTTVRLLGRHLTPGNHQAVLAKARGRSRPQIESLIAELAARPDVPTSVRKLAMPMATSHPAAISAPAASGVRSEKLRRLQGLLRREIPDGDPGAIFDRALTLLLERVEKKKLGATARPRPRAPIRPGTDSSIRKPAFRSREVPREVKRAVWRRDDGQCGYICPGGRRCSERTFLEFHHVQPHAKQGPATVANISLRCWRHNQYEAELIFGPRRDRSCGGAPALRP